MNRKIKIAVGCGIILLVLGGLCQVPAGIEAEKPIPTKATKKIVEEVDNLASNGIPASTAFAKELAKVLSAHQVSLPDKLAQLRPPISPVSDPNEVQIKIIFEPCQKIFNICKDSTWIKDPNYIVPVSLRNELLVAVVNYSPDSMNRVKAAELLVERALPGDETKNVPDVSALQANKACAVAINHVLKRAAEGKVDPYLASGASLVLKHLLLESMTAEKPTRESLDKFLLGYTSKASAALEATNDERLIQALNNLKKSLQNAEKHTELYAQVASHRIELEPVIKAFLDAVNKEDKEKVKQFMTAESVAYLAKKTDQAWSLREDISQLPDIKEIRYQSIGLISDTRKQGNNIIVNVPINVILISKDGTRKYKTIESAAEKTSKGWLLGS